jgi:hypothetical protein
VLPLIQNPASVPRGQFERLNAVVGRDENDNLTRLARQAGLAKETVLMTCLALALGRFAAQPRFSLNVTTSYRQGKHLNPEVTSFAFAPFSLPTSAGRRNACFWPHQFTHTARTAWP